MVGCTMHGALARRQDMVTATAHPYPLAVPSKCIFVRSFIHIHVVCTHGRLREGRRVPRRRGAARCGVERGAVRPAGGLLSSGARRLARATWSPERAASTRVCGADRAAVARKVTSQNVLDASDYAPPVATSATCAAHAVSSATSVIAIGPL